MATGGSSGLQVGSSGNRVDEETGNLELEDCLEEIDLENLTDNQSRIDSVLKFLLNYNANKKTVGRPRRNIANNTGTPRRSTANNVGTPVLLQDEGNDDTQYLVPEELRDSI